MTENSGQGGELTGTLQPRRSRPDGSVEVDREAIARDATWAPGQLQAHFQKHGGEGPWASESVYDASAREVVKIRDGVHLP
ncbi:MAG: hypothetical protein U0893_18215 [Chloroflexota bacterium]